MSSSARKHERMHACYASTAASSCRRLHRLLLASVPLLVILSLHLGTAAATVSGAEASANVPPSAASGPPSPPSLLSQETPSGGQPSPSSPSSPPGSSGSSIFVSGHGASVLYSSWNLVSAAFTMIFLPNSAARLTFTEENKYVCRQDDVTCTYPNESLLNLDTDFPALAPFYLQAERSFHCGIAWGNLRAAYFLGPLVALLYLLLIWLGSKYMENRKPYDLSTCLKCWNLCLACFSFVGMLRVVPHLAYILYRYGFVVSLCSPAVFIYGHGATGLWVLLFIYSKFIELADTIFIILRKKELGFLHWYHHCTVLWFTWDAYCVEQPAGIYFVAMNYTVHTIMYFYYFLSAHLQRRLSWAIFVTMAQISQMIGGVFVTICSLYYAAAYQRKEEWHVSEVPHPLDYGVHTSMGNLVGCIFMYSTYFYLFANYFTRRYLKKRHERQSMSRRKEDEVRPVDVELKKCL